MQQDVRLYLVCMFDRYENVRHLALHRLTKARVTEFQAERPKDFSLDSYVNSCHFNYSDGSGRKVDFRNTIIIMTSNVGSRDVVKKSVQVGYSTVSKSATASATPRCEYRKALEQTFAPEFLNRIDDIVLFRTLELSDVERIIELELQGLFERTRRLGYKVKITDGAKRRLAAMGYESRYGVRSLKRTLMDNVEEPLSTLIIDGKLHEGDTVVVESDKSHGVKLRVA